MFLAGGFGYGMDLKKAARIGLLPGVLLDRVEVVGNTALSGAKLYLMDPEAVRRLREPEFQDCYVDAMYFEE